jgi:hypothetical protein
VDQRRPWDFEEDLRYCTDCSKEQISEGDLRGRSPSRVPLNVHRMCAPE